MSRTGERGGRYAQEQQQQARTLLAPQSMLVPQPPPPINDADRKRSPHRPQLRLTTSTSALPAPRPHSMTPDASRGTRRQSDPTRQRSRLLAKSEDATKRSCALLKPTLTPSPAQRERLQRAGVLTTPPEENLRPNRTFKALEQSPARSRISRAVSVPAVLCRRCQCAVADEAVTVAVSLATASTPNTYDEDDDNSGNREHKKLSCSLPESPPPPLRGFAGHHDADDADDERDPLEHTYRRASPSKPLQQRARARVSPLPLHNPRGFAVSKRSAALRPSLRLRFGSRSVSGSKKPEPPQQPRVNGFTREQHAHLSLSGSVFHPQSARSENPADLCAGSLQHFYDADYEEAAHLVAAQPQQQPLRLRHGAVWSFSDDEEEDEELQVEEEETPSPLSAGSAGQLQAPRMSPLTVLAGRRYLDRRATGVRLLRASRRPASADGDVARGCLGGGRGCANEEEEEEERAAERERRDRREQRQRRLALLLS